MIRSVGASKKKMGKNHELRVKIEEMEKEKIQRKADELGIKLSAYIRMVSLNFDVDKLQENGKWNHQQLIMLWEYF